MAPPPLDDSDEFSFGDFLEDPIDESSEGGTSRISLRDKITNAYNEMTAQERADVEQRLAYWFKSHPL